MPTAQLLHATAPLDEYWPELHAPVAAERPMEAQYDPLGQSEQAVALGAEYIPAAQAPVTEAPPALQKLPAVQGKHAERPVDGQNEPAKQMAQDCSPGLGWYWPKAQLAQAIWPVPDWNRPTRQFVQLDDPVLNS